MVDTEMAMEKAVWTSAEREWEWKATVFLMWM